MKRNPSYISRKVSFRQKFHKAFNEQHNMRTGRAKLAIEFSRKVSFRQKTHRAFNYKQGRLELNLKSVWN